MKKLKEILQELTRCNKLGINGALGTIVSTEGSTYQKTGTKCFISEDGRITGLVSGGCVEGDLKGIADMVIKNAKSQIVHYNFQDEGDLIWGLGLGCNGKMNILLEPYVPKENPLKAELLEMWFELGLTRQLHSITIIEAHNQNLVGEKWIVDPRSPDYQKIPHKEIISNYLSMKDLWPGSCTLQIKGQEEITVFYDVIYPPPRLAIFGAGPDAVPLVQLAKKMKWHVTVMDHRPGFVNADFFPEADELICFPAGETPDINMDSNTYLILMSHHFLQDQLMFKKAIDFDVAYIGLLGPRKRTQQLSEELEIRNYNVTEKIHSPVGIDLGAETPEEIALSIMSEVMQVYRGGTGKKLTELKGPLTLFNKENLAL